ncbi:MAG: response regulator [Bacteroidales bacterium]|nr:response regulator [Bacteroidales bacterium]
MKKKVLILEDDYLLAELIKINLIKAGYEVECRHSGSDGFDFLMQNQDYFLITDYRLSDMTCIDFIEKLNFEKVEISFLVITGFDKENLGVDVMKHGALDYVVKDLDFNDKIIHATNKAYEVKLMRDALNKSIENIRQSELKLSIIFENIEDIFFMIEEDGTIRELSPSVKKILGIPAYDLINTCIKKLFRRPDDFALMSKEIRNKGSVNSFETILRSHEDKNIYVSISCSIIKIGRNESAIIGVAQDISKNKENERMLFQKVIEAEEKERKKIAETIHDDLGPLLSVIKLYFERIKNFSDNPQKQNEIIESAAEVIDNTIKKSREISNTLSSNVLEVGGLRKAVESFVGKIKLAENLEFEILIEEISIPKHIETLLYRISIELINNSIKHSKATKISLRISKSSKKLELLFGDNGIGFDSNLIKNPEKSPGYGLVGIINKIKMLSGNYEFLDKWGKGFNFRLTFENNVIQ